MTPERLAQIEQMREIHRAERNRWQVALDTITKRHCPFVAYDFVSKQCVTIVGQHSATVWRMDDGGLIDERDWTTAAPPHAYREFLEAKRDLELHGPRNQDDRDEHDNAPEPDVQ